MTVVNKLTRIGALSKYTYEYISAEQTSSISDVHPVLVATKGALEELDNVSENRKAVVIFTNRDESQAYKMRKNYSFIYSEPKPERQLALAHSIFGKNSHCYLFTSKHSDETDQYLEYAKKVGIRLHKLNTSKFSYANQVVGNTDNYKCGIAQRTPNPFPNMNISSLAEKLYEYNNLGLIVYSPGLMKTTAAVGITYSSLEDIANEIDDRTTHTYQTGQPPQSGYTKAYSVSTNWYIQRSLNLIAIKDEKAKLSVEKILKEIEK